MISKKNETLSLGVLRFTQLVLKYKKMNTRLSLVGAGTGDPDLLTIKAVKTLATANVVLYDALVNPKILEYAPKGALKIFTGKRAGKHYSTQDEINQLIVKYAFSHGHVVRLKGGDPFVFGRGHEELTYARLFGISTVVVPGISSSIALAGLQQVPVTKRGINESFWVITGTTRGGKLSSDIAVATQSSATVVILMGLRKIKQITALFQQAGKGQTPVMVVQNGSLPTERVVLGTVNTIAEIVEQEGIQTPATIVIGKVVALHPQYILSKVNTLKN